MKRVVRFARTAGKILLKVVGCLLLLVMVGIASIFLVCHFRPEVVSTAVTHQLKQYTGLVWELHDLQPSLLPPGVRFGNIAAYEENDLPEISGPVFSARELTLVPNALALIVGRIEFRSIVIDTPVFSLVPSLFLNDSAANGLADESDGVDSSRSSAVSSGRTVAALQTSGPADNSGESVTAGAVPSSPKKPAAIAADDTPAVIPFGPLAPARIEDVVPAGVSVPKGEKTFTPRELVAEELTKGLTFFRKKLRRSLRTRLWNLKIVNGIFTRRNDLDEVVLAVKNINIDASLDPWHTSVVKGVVLLPENGLTLDSQLTFRLPPRFAKAVMEVTLNVDATLSLPDTRPITGSTSLAMHWARSDNHLRIDSLSIDAEGDRLNGIFDFDPYTLTAVGQLDIGQLSLPRWFFFARNLPPGLQEALHSITGSLNVSTDFLSVAGTELSAKAGALDITGSLGVADFFNPVVRVDLESDFADADALFPFLATSSDPSRQPVRPEFSMPYLAPFPGPGGEDAPDVWYDVTVLAHKSKVHDLPAEELTVTVIPVGETLTRVGIDCRRVGGGKLDGRLDIDKTLTVMDFDVSGLDLSLLPENIGSSVIFTGRASGKTRLTVDVKNTEWVDIWGIQFDGTIADQGITLTGSDGWTLSAREVAFSGAGSVNTVRAEGLSLTGRWKANTSGAHSSWHPKGNDAVAYTLNGTFAWPDARDKSGYSGIQRIFGDMEAEGTLHLPLGDQIVPVQGRLTSPMEWDIQKNILRLPNYNFKGMGSISNGNMLLDGSGKETVLTTSQRYTLSPRTILASWNLLPEAIQVPNVMAGSTDFMADSKEARFSKLRFDADGAITSGSVSIRQPGGKRKNILWDIQLHAKRLDWDNYITPPTEEEKRNPSTEPWQLQFLDGMDIKSTLIMDHARFRDINFNKMQVDTSLTDKALSVMVLSPDVYGGRVTCQALGRIEPLQSTVSLAKGSLVMKGINLAAAFSDQGKGTDYGGKADMVFDVSGTMKNSADFPAALSGKWSLEIRDGLYPAFMGSKTAGLRNTFSKASSSGQMVKGALITDNFLLTGSMVDMQGKGVLDIAKRMVDMSASVTLAGMPTFPVVVKGDFDSFKVNVAGNFVTGTARVAGSTFLNLFRSILELPGKAVLGVGDLFSTKQKVQKKEYVPHGGKSVEP